MRLTTISGCPGNGFYEAGVTPLTPGKPAELVFDILPTSMIFKAGHRIRLVISFADPRSTPKLDPAPRVAIYHDSTHRSYVTLPIINRVRVLFPSAWANARLLISKHTTILLVHVGGITNCTISSSKRTILPCEYESYRLFIAHRLQQSAQPGKESGSAGGERRHRQEWGWRPRCARCASAQPIRTPKSIQTIGQVLALHPGTMSELPKGTSKCSYGNGIGAQITCRENYDALLELEQMAVRSGHS